MRGSGFLILAVAALSLGVFPEEVRAGRQSVALFPPRPVGMEDGARVSALLGKALEEKLRDRFDVTLVGEGADSPPEERRRKARNLGATYVLTGNVSRIGKTATLDITLAPAEDPGKGRTVFVTAEDRAETERGENGGEGTELPFVYRRMATSASAKMKLLFFGDGQVGAGEAKRRIPALSGKVSRSRNIPGEIVAAAMGDTDRDGKPEVVAAQPDSVAVYRLVEENPVEKARIFEGHGNVVHVDVADVNRNGIAEVIVVHYLSGKAVSDVWEFDGKQYRRIASDIPYFLRTADLGPEGIVLLGQESDPVEIFRGPVFRVAIDRYGMGELSERNAHVPLPPGTWIYAFVPVRYRDGVRNVAIGEGGRLRLLDAAGRKVWESIDAVSGSELALEAAVAGLAGDPGGKGERTLFLPGRLFAADLDGDGSDEIVVVNNIVSAGGFFENLRIFKNAEVVCFGQNDESLELAWRTPQIESPAADAFLDIAPGKKSFRVGIASRDKAKILGTFGEWRLYWVK